MKKHNKTLFMLPNPYRLQHFPSYPLDAGDLVRDLNVSTRTANRICEGTRPLKPSELVYLQILHFGFIPDKGFIRGKWFFRDGFLLSHSHNLQIDMNDANAYAILRNNYYLLHGELIQAKERITELELKLGLIKTNIIQFSDYVR